MQSYICYCYYNNCMLHVVEQIIIQIHSAIMLLVPEKMQHRIVMPTLVKVLVHITWKVSAAMDMRLPY